jgi:hypothetical protein
MARKGGGFRPPELRGTLGTLINTALSQAGVVRDALERGAREGRSRLDDIRQNRKRTDALAELGELVLDLIRKGEIDLSELPEAKQLVRYLDEVDGDEPEAAESLDEVVRPASRKRFDDRDDGTVSSGSPTTAARPWAPRKPSAPQRVWRPVVDDPEPAPAEPGAAAPAHAEPRRLPNNPTRKGGIAFDDEDLAEYMHPDDVPAKPSSDGDA